MPDQYPVLEILPELKRELSSNKIVVLQAPPGAGKSTVLPLHLLDEPWLGRKKIIMLEPRRLAARSVANRMASLMEEAAGDTIGYRIRFENNTSSRTRIDVVTEGILTRQLQNDTALDGVGLVIFDEFHERSLQSDLALALCLQVRQIVREDLRILIMSATLATESFSGLPGNLAVIKSEGKQYPVEFRYYNFDPEAFFPLRMARVIRKALKETRGDILAFFPGAGEIRKTEELLKAENIGAAVHVLYGDLSMKKQQEAILPDSNGSRKVVLATSIAETSLTIEGVNVVVDGGYSRVPGFDPRSGLTRLETIRVTKDSATQRAGRAGRLAPGVCYRLWSEGSNAGIVAVKAPEILHADLASLVLELCQWGIKNVNDLTWITTPPAGAVAQAVELLAQLGAVANMKITARGKQMLLLPTHPRIAHMLLDASLDKKTLSIATDVAALLEERDPLGKDEGVDLSLRVDALRKWRKGDFSNVDINILERVERLAESWRRIFKIERNDALCTGTETGKLIAAAYPDRIARQMQQSSERYTLANGKKVKLPQHDPLIHEMWLAIAHLDGGQDGKIFLAAPLKESDLHHLATEQEVFRWDDQRQMVAGAIERRIGNVVLASKTLYEIPVDRKIALISGAVRKEGLGMIGWSGNQKQWQARVMSLNLWRPDDGWPDVTDDHLLQTLELWLAPYLNGVGKRTELENLDLDAIVAGLIPSHLSSKLGKLAPARLEVPSGSAIGLHYFEDGRAPVMEVRLQEIFGWLVTPTVNGGRTNVIMHLLSPGYKPVQVTQDLKSFWKTAYHEVRNELRIKYRKHSWPEDPLKATAVRGPIKKRII